MSKVVHRTTVMDTVRRHNAGLDVPVSVVVVDTSGAAVTARVVVEGVGETVDTVPVEQIRRSRRRVDKPVLVGRRRGRVETVGGRRWRRSRNGPAQRLLLLLLLRLLLERICCFERIRCGHWENTNISLFELL